MASAKSNVWLNRFAWFTAAATLFLICSGGMVTSKGVGLAVPDWPTTFGYNMFLFPFSKWVGGIFFEHTHRLIASAVGFLTIILTIWIWRADSRRSLRWLGVAALGAVILQGVLGGLRVTMLKDQIGIFHAGLAQAFLGLLVVIAIATTGRWRSLSVSVNQNDLKRIGRIAVFTVIAVYIQLALGATMRRGALRAVRLPMLTQADFDRLLWSCQLNFVRGEDSFVRALWAGAPFVWQLYVQDDGAHAAKLDAFLARFLAGAPPALAAALRTLFARWNGTGSGPLAPPLSDPTLRAAWLAHCARWRERLATQDDLVTRLLRFVEAKR